jgi:chemotaxis response regulator CheB
MRIGLVFRDAGEWRPMRTIAAATPHDVAWHADTFDAARANLTRTPVDMLVIDLTADAARREVSARALISESGLPVIVAVGPAAGGIGFSLLSAGVAALIRPVGRTDAEIAAEMATAIEGLPMASKRPPAAAPGSTTPRPESGGGNDARSSTGLSEMIADIRAKQEARRKGKGRAAGGARKTGAVRRSEPVRGTGDRARPDDADGDETKADETEESGQARLAGIMAEISERRAARGVKDWSTRGVPAPRTREEAEAQPAVAPDGPAPAPGSDVEEASKSADDNAVGPTLTETLSRIRRARIDRGVADPTMDAPEFDDDDESSSAINIDSGPLDDDDETGETVGLSGMLRRVQSQRRARRESAEARRTLDPAADPRNFDARVTGTGPGCNTLIGIGASAGGPEALAVILSQMPAKMPVPIVIVQHLEDQFVGAFVNWMNSQTRLPVESASHGATPMPGRVYIAPARGHLVLTPSGHFGISSEPRKNPYRPSIDVFFHSIPPVIAKRSTFAILTGMQRDGAQGLLALRRAGAYTIAQDRFTSTVYGMPKAAAALGAAVDILPLPRIAPTLAQRFGISPFRASLEDLDE